MKTVNKKMIYCLAFAICLGTAALAQPEDNGGDPPPSDVPLDGGSGALVIAGIAYGIKKIRSNTAKRKEIKQS